MTDMKDGVAEKHQHPVLSHASVRAPPPKSAMREEIVIQSYVIREMA